MFQVHTKSDRYCDRVVIVFRCFQGAEQENVSSFNGKKIWLKFFLLFLTDLKSQGFYLISWVFIYISKVKMQDYKMALIVEFYDTYYLLTQKSEWS